MYSSHKTCSVLTMIPLFANKGTKIKLKRTLVPLLPAYHSKKQEKAENNGFCVRKALNLALLLANSGPPVRISPCILHIDCPMFILLNRHCHFPLFRENGEIYG
ncbi:hypothetical protein AK95_24740 [Paenibacillus sp. LC231]|nr:hypothetical protein AK95_24740 [Paenibacillus sp. LC231]